ncbi:MAG: hypothetical protein EOP09_07430 [Proteobacteria bacterium]|nr:MAG: hypothetical protein EOP09_07430 [Pseudomonadota bacterium]
MALTDPAFHAVTTGRKDALIAVFHTFKVSSSKLEKKKPAMVRFGKRLPVAILSHENVSFHAQS